MISLCFCINIFEHLMKAKIISIMVFIEYTKKRDLLYFNLLQEDLFKCKNGKLDLIDFDSYLC